MRSTGVSLIVCILAIAAHAAEDQPRPEPAPGQVSVLLSPFVPLGEGSIAWMGPAIQQNILNDLSRQQMLHAATIAKDQPAPADAPAAVKAAKAAGARYALYGTIQLAEGNLRVMGQIVDSDTGKHVGAIKATGTTRDLFLIEDTLADQARRLLLAQVPPPPAPVQPAPVQAQGNQPQVIIIQMPAPQAAPQPAPEPVLPIVFPWNRDQGDIQAARRRLVLDDEFDAALDRRLQYYNTGYYGSYFGGYYGYWPSYWRSGYHCHRPRVTPFPGGVVRGSFRPIPGGIINVCWRW